MFDEKNICYIVFPEYKFTSTHNTDCTQNNKRKNKKKQLNFFFLFILKLKKGSSVRLYI